MWKTESHRAGLPFESGMHLIVTNCKQIDTKKILTISENKCHCF